LILSSSAVITVTLLPMRLAGVSVRVAVTTVSSSPSEAAAKTAADVRTLTAANNTAAPRPSGGVHRMNVFIASFSSLTRREKAKRHHLPHPGQVSWLSDSGTANAGP